jgi:hypothetical protein
MPYLIDNGGHDFAVASLEDARRELRRRLPAGEDSLIRRAFLSAVDCLPADVDRVMPELSDGTVIDVRPVDAWELGHEIGLISADHAQLWPLADLIERFNTR